MNRSRHFSRAGLNPVVGLSMLLIALIQLASSTTGQLDYRRFTSGIEIHIEPFSLAYAALEDEFLDVDEEWEWIPQNHPSTFLRAGEIQTGAPTLLSRLGSTGSQVGRALVAAAARPVKVQLQGMQMNLAKILAESGQIFSLEADGNQLRPAQEVTEGRSPARVVGSAPTVFGRNTRPAEGSRISPQRRVARVNHASHQVQENSESQGAARNAGVGPVVMGAHHQPSAVQREGFARRTNKGQQRYVRKPDGTSRAKRDTKRANDRGVEAFARYSEESGGRKPQGYRHDLFIEGQIELAEGMAFLGSGDQLIVYRENFGEIEQGGNVSIHDGDYSIWVSELTGRLVADLVSAEGRVYGRGEVDLDAITVEKDQKKIENIRLTISEAASGLVGLTKTFHSYDKKVFAVSEAQIGIEGFDLHYRSEMSGVVQDPLVLPGTQFISRVEKEGFWPTLTYMSEGQKKDILMLSDSDISAIAGLVYDLNQGVPDLKGIILGRVTDQGRPISGAKVYLNGSMMARPVYFSDVNGLIVPDPNLEATTSNGLFVFLQQPTSLTSIEAERAGRSSELLLLPVEEGHVSQVQLELSQSEKLRLRITEAFGDQKPLDGVVNFLGSAKTHKAPANGDFTLNFAPGDQPIWLDVAQPHSDFMPVTVSQARRENGLNIPLVGKEWLKTFYEQTGEEMILNRGFIVGFIDHMNRYEVLLDHVAVESGQKVYYFDKEGQWLPGNQGVAGGGFIILNAEEGLHSLILQAEGSAHYLGKTAYVEPGRAALILDADLY